MSATTYSASGERLFRLPPEAVPCRCVRDPLC